MGLPRGSVDGPPCGRIPSGGREEGDDHTGSGRAACPGGCGWAMELRAEEERAAGVCEKIP